MAIFADGILEGTRTASKRARFFVMQPSLAGSPGRNPDVCLSTRLARQLVKDCHYPRILDLWLLADYMKLLLKGQLCACGFRVRASWAFGPA
jgi:hypothetical protein